MGKSKSGIYVERVRVQMLQEEKLKLMAEKKKASIPSSEKEYGSKLNILGREAFFDEYFGNVKLENQIFAPVGEYLDPRLTVSFKKGYERGKVLAENGFVPDRYKTDKKMHK